MKNLKKISLSLLLSLISYGAVAHTNILASNVIQLKSEGITVNDIIVYLKANGHEILSTPIVDDAGLNWHCITIGRDGHLYNTTVFTDGLNINGYDDESVD